MTTDEQRAKWRAKYRRRAEAMRVRGRAYYWQNREERLEYQKRYKWEQRAQYLESKRRYRARHRDPLIDQRKAERSYQCKLREATKRLRASRRVRKAEVIVRKRWVRASRQMFRTLRTVRWRWACLGIYKQMRKCADCGVDDPIVLEFDHLPGHEKAFSIGHGIYDPRRLWTEVLKCDVVCANCHKRRTRARWGPKMDTVAYAKRYGAHRGPRKRRRA